MGDSNFVRGNFVNLRAALLLCWGMALAQETAPVMGPIQLGSVPSAPTSMMDSVPSPRVALVQPLAAPRILDSSAFQKLIGHLGYKLPVYGLDFFATPLPVASAQIPVADDYLVGPGDQVEVRIWGSVNLQQSSVVDRNGQIYIPQVGSVSVAGVRFRDLKGHINSAVARMFRNFDVSASLGKLRGVQVYVTGQAVRPGIYQLGGMSTLLNALVASGGPDATGSVRAIELRRGGTTVAKFDLYDLLSRGDKSRDLSLGNGDVIYIPHVGPQVAVMGARDKGIYEIKSGESVSDVLGYAGGLGINTQTRQVRLESMVRDSGMRVQVSSWDQIKSRGLQGGEILSFADQIEKFEGAVTLSGPVLNPGRYPWHTGMKISDLIPSSMDLVGQEFYRSQNRTVNGGANQLGTTDSLLGINWEYAVIERFNPDSMRMQMIPFELGRAVMEHDPKQDLEIKSGDVVRVFSTADVSVPVSKRPVYVTIEGEVNKVGTYRILPGEKLHDAIRRAGGLTQDSYVFGMKFLRRSAQAQQEANYQKVIAEMEKQFESSAADQLASASGPEAAKAAQEQVEAQRKWFAKLREFKPEGRLVMEMDDDVDLALDDIPNVGLEDGDRVVIPARPSVVSVFGEVPMQNAFFYRRSNDIGDYVSRAGGATRFADEGSTFVIRADGSVKSERETGWLFFGNLSGRDAMPGDAIFVPKRLEYSRWLADLKDFSQVLSNFGLGAAAIMTLVKGLK